MTKKLLKAVFSAILCMAILSVYASASYYAPSWKGERIYKDILYLAGNEYDYDSIIWSALDQNGKYGIINSRGETLYPFELDSMPNCKYSQIIITQNGKKGLLNSKCEIILPPEYDAVYFGYPITAKKDGKLCFFYSSGTMFLETPYDVLAISLGNNYFLVLYSGKYGLIDRSGNILINFEFDDYYTTFDNHICVSKGDKKGLINNDGKLIFDAEYDYIYAFKNGNNNLIQAKKDGKFGLYDYDGKIVLQPEYDDYIKEFGDSGYLEVRKNGRSSLITYDGATIVDYLFDDMFYYSDKYFGIEVAGKYGMADYNGNIIIQPEYDDGCVELVDDNTVNIWQFEPVQKIIETINLSTGISVMPSVPSVSVPAFSVTINNSMISNTTALYPCIVYNDITYFPMTYSDSRALGLVADWTAENGLVIEKTNTEPYAPSFEQGENTNASGQTAAIVEGKVTVNGKAIDNASEEYPLLLFRDVTYFPLTWRFAVEEFGWNYSFTSSDGLVINSK